MIKRKSFLKKKGTLAKKGFRIRGMKSNKAPRRKKNPYTVKALDTVFSRFIRISHANKEGIASCYTCPYQAHYKKLHAGHYISRWFKATRWHENNVRPQCYMCNIFRKGNAVIFRRHLVEEIGEAQVTEMEKAADYLIRGFADPELLKEKIEYFQSKLPVISS